MIYHRYVSVGLVKRFKLILRKIIGERYMLIWTLSYLSDLIEWRLKPEALHGHGAFRSIGFPKDKEKVTALPQSMFSSAACMSTVG